MIDWPEMFTRDRTGQERATATMETSSRPPISEVRLNDVVIALMPLLLREPASLLGSVPTDRRLPLRCPRG